jgi:microcystin-dependent protein
MSTEPFLGQIMMCGFNFPPKGWALCNGQLLAINQNQALFALLGTTYGGNGTTTFALPNLQARIPIHTGNGFVLGQSAGETAHTLSLTELPAHSHSLIAGAGSADQNSAANNYIASSGSNRFASAPDSALLASAVAATGGGQPHNNESPYLVINFVIALQGIFPSQN